MGRDNVAKLIARAVHLFLSVLILQSIPTSLGRALRSALPPLGTGHSIG